MIKKTLKKRQDALISQIEDIEIEAIRLSDQLYGLEKAWERKVRKLTKEGLRYEMVWCDVVE